MHEVAATRRLRSIDAFRGFVLAFMLFTPPNGDPAHFPLLHHADWNGLTASDLIFPTFLVTSGLSLGFLLKPGADPRVRVRLARRVVLLLVIGLAYNAYGTSGFDLSRLRFTGVLQLIGIAGGVAVLVVVTSRWRTNGDRPLVIAAIAAGLTAAHGLLLEMRADRCGDVVPCSPVFGIDRTVLGESHLYRGGALRYDPEGVIVCLAASALVLTGYLAGRHLRRGGSLAPIAMAATALLGMAALLDLLQPVNKRLLTPAFVSVTAGIALIGVSLAWILLDRPARGHGAAIERWRARSAFPFVAFGRNALVTFLTERFLVQTARLVHVGDRTVERWLLDELPIGAPGVHLAYGVGVLALVAVPVLLLHRSRRYVVL